MLAQQSLIFGCDKTLLTEPLELMRRLGQSSTVHCDMQVVRQGCWNPQGTCFHLLLTFQESSQVSRQYGVVLCCPGVTVPRNVKNNRL